MVKKKARTLVQVRVADVHKERELRVGISRVDLRENELQLVLAGHSGAVKSQPQSLVQLHNGLQLAVRRRNTLTLSFEILDVADVGHLGLLQRAAEGFYLIPELICLKLRGGEAVTQHNT